jgi:hypothetical protein
MRTNTAYLFEGQYVFRNPKYMRTYMAYKKVKDMARSSVGGNPYYEKNGI